jgi:DNA-packaging protein gp3
MAAPKENKFWKLRSKHGRDKLFTTPDLLWKAACEYFQWVDDHPWLKIEQVKVPAKAVKDEETGKYIFPPPLVDLPTARPYTMEGLCRYLDCNTAYFRTFKRQLPAGEIDFNTIITRIEEVVYQQKFEGAAVGAFQQNIIARDLGLVDRKGIIPMDNKEEFDYSKLSDAALEEIEKITGTESDEGEG